MSLLPAKSTTALHLHLLQTENIPMKIYLVLRYYDTEYRIFKLAVTYLPSHLMAKYIQTAIHRYPRSIFFTMKTLN